MDLDYIFTYLQTLVEEQGNTLDNIESQVEATQEYVQETIALLAET